MTCHKKLDGLDVQLDRLVDGELSPEEYRQLIPDLDRHVDGWKRCAVAFLEAQAWRQDLSTARGTETNRPAAVPAGRVAWRWWTQCVGMAASLMVAFGVGWAFGRPADEFPRGGQSLAASQSPRAMLTQTAVAPAIAGHPDQVEVVFAGNDGDWRNASRLPVRSLDDRNQEDLVEDFWSTPRVVELLRQSGRMVTHDQDVVPLKLPDGREILMPVERVEIMPVKKPAY